jgi:hypothetical protein
MATIYLKTYALTCCQTTYKPGLHHLCVKPSVQTGKTALHKAAIHDRTAVIQLLMDKGAHIDAKDEVGTSKDAVATLSQSTPRV